MSISEQSIGRAPISAPVEETERRAPLRRRFVMLVDRQAQPEAR